MRTCEYCDKPAARGELCWTHVKRKQRGQCLSAPIQERLSPDKRLLAASTARNNAESEEDYERLTRQLKQHAKAYGYGMPIAKYYRLKRKQSVHVAPQNINPS